MSSLKLKIALWALLAPGIQAFSWGSERRAARRESYFREQQPLAESNMPKVATRPTFNNNANPSEILQNSASRLSDVYALAVHELQELESEPLCHRVAARLLVNNCQLVDGKDEATILTDSGRQVRDFVDSYAASLAICDLERGRFVIPHQCTKFREPALSEVAIRNEPQLHVSTKEIELCLSALGQSDAAWSTWISYRHKALRFCEAARADNEKSQNILLYQRLTQIIAKLTDGVEAELNKRMNDIENRARQSMENLEKLSPQIDHLKGSLADLEKYLSQDVKNVLGKSTESLHDSLENAQNLQQLMHILVANVIESNTRLASAHEVSVQQASQRANADISALMAVVATVSASSDSLQRQIEESNKQAAALAQRQETLERGMDRLLVATETIAAKYEDHTHTLTQARNLTNDLLDSLEETAATVSDVKSSLFRDVSPGNWWPHIVFPTVTLVMGSYGLPPSFIRNFGLLALGEGIGCAVSSFDELADIFTNSFLPTSGLAANVTTASSL
ncbi:nuclear fusion protein KAR5 [Naviculisporaceae sp. PSN 640]